MEEREQGPPKENETLPLYELILEVKRKQSGLSVCQSVKQRWIICPSNVFIN